MGGRSQMDVGVNKSRRSVLVAGIHHVGEFGQDG
jgi:hypothetical protein